MPRNPIGTSQPNQWTPPDELRQLRLSRFLSSFEVDPLTGCWLWQSTMLRKGYGKTGNVLAHRYSYVQFVGPIPVGRQIDHLCRAHACVNPDHLEAVTARENLMRGDTMAARRAAITHCPVGHRYDRKNTYITRRNERKCRACGRSAARIRRLEASHS